MILFPKLQRHQLPQGGDRGQKVRVGTSVHRWGRGRVGRGAKLKLKGKRENWRKKKSTWWLFGPRGVVGSPWEWCNLRRWLDYEFDSEPVKDFVSQNSGGVSVTHFSSSKNEKRQPFPVSHELTQKNRFTGQKSTEDSPASSVSRHWNDMGEALEDLERRGQFSASIICLLVPLPSLDCECSSVDNESLFVKLTWEFSRCFLSSNHVPVRERTLAWLKFLF